MDWDLRKAIAANAVAAWHPIGTEDPTNASKRTALQPGVEAALQQPDRLAVVAVVDNLARREPQITNIDAFGISVRLYRRYLRSGRLPKIGPSDDLSHPPIERRARCL